MRARLSILLLLLCIPVAALAQPEPIKWGKFTPEELALKDYPADTNAAAIVLADYGSVEFDRDYEVVFTHHRRIKILKESGYDWGTFEMTYYAAKGAQSVGGIRGQTVKAGPDGKLTALKLEKKSIFEEKVDADYRRVKFTLPGLEPGAIIEYSYQMTASTPVLVPSWQFQLGEPVLHSEFRFELPGTMSFVRASRGILAFDIEEAIPLQRPYGKGQMNRWVMKNVAALREEPYMTTPNDYRASLDFQLSSIAFPGETIKFLTTWNELARTLNENPYFGQRLEAGRSVRNRVEELTAGLQSQTEKMRAIYDFVRSNIKWNESLAVFADQDVAGVLKTQTGSSAEIAFLLTCMLREAGLAADPVLISTRAHGRIVDQYPLLSQFNDVLVNVQADGSSWLLSATDPDRAHDLLPLRALNGKGWLVRKGEAQWLPINARGRYRQVASVIGALDSTGTLTATYTGSNAEYAALDRRHDIKEMGDDRKYAIEHILNSVEEPGVDSVSIVNLNDASKPLDTKVKFSVPSYAQVTGDFLYVNPTVVERTTENPLKMPTRTFPVDMGYPHDITYTLKLKVPTGYQVLEKPSSMHLVIPSGGATYSRSIEVTNDVVDVQTRFVIGKAVFEPRQYAELREFYSRVVAAEAEQIVLKRNEATAGATSTK